jgi:hypothetical protein
MLMCIVFVYFIFSFVLHAPPIFLHWMMSDVKYKLRPVPILLLLLFSLVTIFSSAPCWNQLLLLGQDTTCHVHTKQRSRSISKRFTPRLCTGRHGNGNTTEETHCICVCRNATSRAGSFTVCDRESSTLLDRKWFCDHLTKTQQWDCEVCSQEAAQNKKFWEERMPSVRDLGCDAV